MENVFSYIPNLKIEIGGKGGHFKNSGRWIWKKDLILTTGATSE